MDPKWLLRILLGRFLFTVFVCFIFLASLLGSSRDVCDFPAIYNFGDSNSDTGSASAAFFRLNLPNGITYFGKPSGRYCDGRLMIDFIAGKLGIPFLKPYLDSIDANFRKGANFASGGATVQRASAEVYGAGFSPLSLVTIQLSEFKQLKDRTTEIYTQDKGLLNKDILPRPKDFSKALYTLDCGQNDLHFLLTTMSMKDARASIPHVADQYALAVEALYGEGARIFWIHNTGPIGCLPFFVLQSPPMPGDADEIGCIKSFNEAAKEFNHRLKENVSRLRSKLPDATLVLVDIYSAKYSLISNAEKNGFVGPFDYCCGYSRDSPDEMGFCSTKIVNGTQVFPSHCADPSRYISWDSIHYTDAANQWIVNRILDGSHSYPAVPMDRACHARKDDHSWPINSQL